jgi:hypothetical protein
MKVIVDGWSFYRRGWPLGGPFGIKDLDFSERTGRTSQASGC